MRTLIIALLLSVTMGVNAAPFARLVASVSDTEQETLTITRRGCDLSAKYAEQITQYYEDGLDQDQRATKLIETLPGQLADDEVWVGVAYAMKINSQLIFVTSLPVIQQFVKKGQTYPQAVASLTREGCPSVIGNLTQAMRRIYAK